MQNCKITLLVILNSIIEKIRMQYNGSNLLLDSFLSIIKRNIINKRNKNCMFPIILTLLIS